MFRKLFPLVVIGFWKIVALPLPEQASGSTPLTRAVILKLHNWVQLMPHNQLKRPARKSDSMNPGDGLSTGRASLAELRFNDGSLARVGEQAVFRFLPKSRNFRLSNGTVLLLIPPGKGKTRINTPNAAAAIRGSALFVRYDQSKDTTVVAALTTSGIEVFNQDATQSQELKAGQLAVIVKGRLQGLYEFDLRNFYDTSDLVRGLDLPQRDQPATDPAIAQVQAETAAAVASQAPVVGKGIVENPSFTQLSTSSSNSSNNSKVNDNPAVNSSSSNTHSTSNNSNRNNNSENQKNATDTSNTSNSENQKNATDTSNTSNSENQKNATDTSNTSNSENQKNATDTSNTFNSENQKDAADTSNTSNSENQKDAADTSNTFNSENQKNATDTSNTSNSDNQDIIDRQSNTQNQLQKTTTQDSATPPPTTTQDSAPQPPTTTQDSATPPPPTTTQDSATPPPPTTTQDSATPPPPTTTPDLAPAP